MNSAVSEYVLAEWRGKRLGSYGGASRDRTDDLIVANDALSQLSYSPTENLLFQK
jgi:hypothetical protein